MPWTGPSFRPKNHSLSPAQAAHAAHIANAILRRGAPEGVAIATANKLAHRDAGGSVDPTQQGIGGIAPSAQTMNPMTQGLIQRYASMPTEKLAETAAMMGGTPQGQIIQRILQQRRMMPQQAQQGQAQPQQGALSPAQAPAIQQPAAMPAQAHGGGIPRRAGGGDMGLSLSQADPWWTRSEASGDSRQPSLGFLEGSTPGRADAVRTTAPAGSYVIPADVVAGLGEGNSLAGSRRMEEILNSGPHGTPEPRQQRGRGLPHAPAPLREAKGGGIAGEEPTPVLLSHGEYVVSPHHVARWGGGDLKAGHRALDEWVVKERKRQIEKLKRLPGPVKS